MSEKINLTNDQLEMLKLLLHTFNLSGDRALALNYDDVVQYEYSILESKKLIDLYNFRLSGDVQKSYSIIELIERIKQNDDPSIIMHNLAVKGDKNFMIYSSIGCKKIIYTLPFGGGKSG